MKYEIYKLKFSTPVRFGGDRYSHGFMSNTMCPHADTLFSAISHEWIQLFGIASYQEFVEYARGEDFQLSDLMPYKSDERGNYSLFIPKPVIHLDVAHNERDVQSVNMKKKLKKLEYINIESIEDYMHYLCQGGELPLSEVSFGSPHVIGKVSIDRESYPLPYNMSSFIFDEHAGLYFILKCSDPFREPFNQLMNSLGETGLGGKKTSGYGKFNLAEEAYEIGIENDEYFGIYESDLALTEKLCAPHPGYLSISLLYPTEEDLENLSEADTYSIIERRGFVYSANYAEQFVKRQNSFALKRGSVFAHPLQGQILDLSITGNHPVYRYGKGFFIGGMAHEFIQAVAL
jgi:CRISPR-associated protein Csm4